MPTYNGASFIEETLNSAINQSYKNIEIIITDDHSSDNTLNICKQFADKDSRIKIYKNDKNLGLVGNWKQSIAKANSKWVKFLFQDDLLEPTCIEQMIRAAIDNNSNFVICNRAYFFEDGFDERIKRHYTENLPKTDLIFKENRVYKPEETAKLIAPHLFNNCIGEPPTFLFNRDFYSEEDFPENYFQLVDFIFILNKILVHNFYFIGTKLVKFRVHTASESSKNNAVDNSNKKAFHKFLYIQFYEKIQICNEIINNPIFVSAKKHLKIKDVLKIKDWYVIKSYKKYGFKNVLPFYQNSALKDFIINNYTSNYSYLKYRVFKVVNKKLKKKYKV